MLEKEQDLTKANFPNKRVARHNALVNLMLRKMQKELETSVLSGSNTKMIDGLVGSGEDGDISHRLEVERQRVRHVLEQIRFTKKAVRHEGKMAICVEQEGAGILGFFEGKSRMSLDYQRRLDQAREDRKKAGGSGPGKSFKPKDKPKKDKDGEEKKAKSKPFDNAKKGLCFACGKQGHFASECRSVKNKSE